MNDDKGKVIISLLAGATAGIVAGLLLAPETGDEARASLRKSAMKWGGDLRDLLQGALNKAQDAAVPNQNAAVSEDKAAADRLFSSMGIATPSDENDLDYDGDGGDGRHHVL